MRAALTLGLALALVAGALTGCGQKNSLTDPAGAPGSPGGSTANDQAEISGALAAAPELVEDALFEDPTQTSLGDGPTGATALLHPLTTWRTITNVERRFEFAFADTDSAGRPTTAVVTVHRYLHGRFNILSGERDPNRPPDQDTMIVAHKPLADHWVRRILMKRVPRPDSVGAWRTMWRVAATSGVKVTSYDPQAMTPSPAYGRTRIVSLRVQDAGLDTTLTDPLAFFRLRRLLRFQAGETLTLTVTTRASDDVVVLLHRGLRKAFHNNGDNTYTGTWPAAWLPGVRHLGVNALSHGTLFDDTLPYASQAWILPYVVQPTELAEYMP